MQLKKQSIFFSPSDLITFMDSEFASAMEHKRLFDLSLSSLIDAEDVMLKSLQDKGYKHEEEYVFNLQKQGVGVTEIANGSKMKMHDDTIAAMQAGAEVITQAYVTKEVFGGLADLLVRVDGPSKLGDYHYEVWDTKLSKKVKPYFAIQLCCYAEMITEIQGVRPENVSVVLGDNKKVDLRVQDYFAYYKCLKNRFIEFHAKLDFELIPDPAVSNAHGRWSEYAASLLEQRDHLSLIANITRTQIKKLEKSKILTVQDLLDTEVGHVPTLSNEIFQRLKFQAEIQVQSRGKDVPSFKVLPHLPRVPKGLAALPPHSSKDVFFDIEGYPLMDGGLEYLWGVTYFKDNNERTFIDFWAHDAEQEKQAFSDFVDWVFARWQADPSMHIYHYASYEVTALRKLMGKYGVKEFEVDTLLRNEVFVDLYNVVRHGILIGEPRYSIKNVEHLYRRKRETDVASGGESVVVYEAWRENPDGQTWQKSKILNSIRDYNIDDCDSTQELTDWLREVQALHNVTYVQHKDDMAPEPQEEENDVTRLRDELHILAGIVENEDKSILYRNLAWLLEFHKREEKPVWWQYFDRLGMTEFELYQDMDCVAKAVRTEREPYRAPKARLYSYEFAYDREQAFKASATKYEVLDQEGLSVTLVSHDADGGTFLVKCRDELPNMVSLIPKDNISAALIAQAVFDQVETMLKDDFPQSAITDFLMRQSPRFKDGRESVIPEDTSAEHLIDEITNAASNLNASYLCIQGPPGAGKTYTAKHVIGQLLKQGYNIGISSNSHKAINNLMDGVSKYTSEQDIKGSISKVGGSDKDELFENSNVAYVKSVKDILQDLYSDGNCVGGTAWAFCNTALRQMEGQPIFDYLFIDEAGQVSIANLVGMSRVTRNIILMGDQMQLGQPIQGSHPDDSGQSILEYLLQDQATIPPELGVFLPITYRMHPNVCKVVSNQVYDGKLSSADVAAYYEINTSGPLINKKAGVLYFSVEHEGNSQGSSEEVEIVCQLVEELIGSEYWPDADCEKRYIRLEDILFVAPYNYQVGLLKSALGDKAKVGSVDRFQGQEAPIVIMSMCSSDPAESARGIDFLYSTNRMNVALSRAQALAIVVGHPKLPVISVNSIKQMKQVGFVSYISDQEE